MCHIGGTYAAVLSLLARDNLTPDLHPTRNRIKIDKQLLFYPSVDRSRTTQYKSVEEFKNPYMLPKETSNFFLKSYMPRDADVTIFTRDIRVSPLLAKSFKGLPPTVLVTAELDVLRDVGIAYKDRLRKSGVRCHYVRVLNSTHGFISMSFLPEMKETLRSALDMLEDI